MKNEINIKKLVKKADNYLLKASHDLILWLPFVLIGFASLFAIIGAFIVTISELLAGRWINALETIGLGIIAFYLMRGCSKVIEEIKNITEENGKQ